MKHGAGILFTDGKKILLLKRAEGDEQGAWGLPGGGAKQGESTLETAKREVREECGVSAIPGVRWAEIRQSDTDFTWTTFMYSVTTTFKLDKLSSEHDDWAWFDLSKIGSERLHSKLKPQIPGYVAKIRRKFSEKFAEWVWYSEILSKLWL